MSSSLRTCQGWSAIQAVRLREARMVRLDDQRLARLPARTPIGVVSTVVSRPYGGCTAPAHHMGSGPTRGKYYPSRLPWAGRRGKPRACDRRSHRQTMGSRCDARSRCAQMAGHDLSGDDLTRDIRHRTHDETAAITYGVQTPAIAVVRMNVFRVPTGRAVDPGGALVAGGFERFDSRSHAASVSQPGDRSIR